MKTRLLTLILLIIILLPFSANCQEFADDDNVFTEPIAYEAPEYLNEIDVTVGPASGLSSILFLFVDIGEAISSSASNRPAKINWIGSYSLEYYRQINSWFRVGCKAIFEGQNTKYYNDSTKTTLYNKYFTGVTTVMPSVQFSYYNKGIVLLYSGLDLGVMVLWKNDKLDGGFAQATFAFNVTPFGIRVGKRLYGMGEINIGYDSLVKFGIGYRF